MFSRFVVEKLLVNLTLCSMLCVFTFNAQARPVCERSDSDSDGDGFGWENSATCLVAVTPATGPANSPADGSSSQSSGSTARALIPYCSNALSDPDGDGFGWENNASCVVAEFSLPAESSAPPVSAATGNGGLLAEEKVNLSLPACSHDRFDFNNDGFGWENSRSCTFKNAGDGGVSITDIILVTGQSNALGAQTAIFDPLSFNAELDSPVRRVYAFSQNGWGIAGLRQIWDRGWYPRGDITSLPANNFAFHFGKQLVRKEPDTVVGIIMVTAPGAGIEFWNSSGDFFATINARVSSALDALPGSPKVSGILWHQGETDFYGNDRYSDLLNNLIGNFRAQSWFANDGVFVCGETLNAPVNERLMRLNTDGDNRTGCVSSAGLESVGDDLHFDAPSLRILGDRYSDKYRSLPR